MNTCITTCEENKCYCQLKQKFCANANDFGYCKISACINYDEK